MPILVVKFGTKELCNEDGRLDQTIFDDFARQLVRVQKNGIEPVIVTSGAIQGGTEELAMLGIIAPGLVKKEIAGNGACRLYGMWRDAFWPHRKAIGLIPVTYRNWLDDGERESIKEDIDDYLPYGIFPVINENDPVSDREIKLMEQGFSENDRLAKMIALLIKADMLLLLTEVGGVYEQDPKVSPRARLYEEIDAGAVPQTLQFTKAVEAAEAYRNGVKRVAVAGRQDDVILKFVAGERVGTTIGTKTILKP